MQDATKEDHSMADPPSPSTSCCSGATRACTGPVRADSMAKDILAERALNQQSACSEEQALESARGTAEASLQQPKTDVTMQHSDCLHSSLAAGSQANAEHGSRRGEHPTMHQSIMHAQQLAASAEMLHSDCLFSSCIAGTQAEVEHESRSGKEEKFKQSSMHIQQEASRQLGKAVKQRALAVRGQGRAPLLVRISASDSQSNPA